MRDKELETKLRILTVQLDNWKKLHDLITYGLDKAKPIISAEQERQFTDVRAHLLQETEYVYKQLNILGELSGKAMNVLQRASSVRGVRELTERRNSPAGNGMERRLHQAGRGAGPTQSAAQGIGFANLCDLLLAAPCPPAGAGLSLIFSLRGALAAPQTICACTNFVFLTNTAAHFGRGARFLL